MSMSAANTRTLHVDSDIYDYLLKSARIIGEDESSILRRLLRIPRATDSIGASRVIAERPPDYRGDTSPDPILDFVNSPQFASHRNVTEKFLALLAFLHDRHQEDFGKVVGLGGRKRSYFGKSRSDIARSGNRTFPRQIPKSDYWVLTNAANHHKRDILRRALQALGYPPTLQASIVAALR